MRLHDIGAFAVVRASVERTLEIADGIVKGGIPAMEVSFTKFWMQKQPDMPFSVVLILSSPAMEMKRLPGYATDIRFLMVPAAQQ